MSTLEEKQEERKQRLAQLKAAAAGQNKRPNENGQHTELRFRSYAPESSELKGFVSEAPAVGPEATEKGLDTVEGRVKKIEKTVAEEEKLKNPELDIIALAPKKPNWDLKRDLEKKLERLERRTMNSISDLIRERLKSEKDISKAAEFSALKEEDE